MTTDLYRALVPGGILSPGELLGLVAFAREAGCDGLHLGSRQDVLLPGTDGVRALAARRHAPPAAGAPSAPPLSPPVSPAVSPAASPVEAPRDLAAVAAVASPPEVAGASALRAPGPLFEPVADSPYSNVVCSYVAAEIFPRTPWLTSATYLYVLEQFGTPPRFEVNVCDPRQRLAPLFTGHLNFVASPEEDFWFVYAQLPAWPAPRLFPALVHSWEIARFVEAAEAIAPAPEGLEALVRGVNARADLDLRGVDRDLEAPFYPFPYYEGMNRIDASTYWLGLYWRNNWYALDFLEAMCRLCLEQRVGKVCITPWKSLIVTGIPDGRRLAWERLMGRFGINARHSSLELNWHLPVADAEALALKTYLVREFDKRDISTYGLTFGVASDYARPFTSVLIRRSPGAPAEVDGFAVRPTYDLLYARNFDPNTREYLEYAHRVDRAELTTLILELSRLYFEQLDEAGGRVIGAAAAEEAPAERRTVYQCRRCLSVYDPEVGDAAADVAAGTAFAALPEGYGCWTCGAGVEAFGAVEM